MKIISSFIKGTEEYTKLQQMYQDVVRQYNVLVQKTSHILDAEEATVRTRTLLKTVQGEYNALVARREQIAVKIKALEKDEELVDVAVYKPAYSFDFATEFKLKLDNIRALQTQKVKDKTAVLVEDTGEKKAEVNRLVKLVLRAFNGECDALASKITWKNISKTLDQVGSAAQAINKLVAGHGISLAPEYINLKLEEMRLIHEHAEKKQPELEEQRAIRAQMREEEKARLEYEKAMKEAAQEQERFEKALAEAESKLEGAHGAELDRLTEAIASLKQQLEGAKEKGLRAQSMAELTKSGYVYVISNVGAFGERMFKIGMTRRLEPLDRVHELGDASVPFKFDVHAMIYSKDAPALENKLHAHFKARQVNLVNDRKEFFYADLSEIERAVRSLGAEVEFTRVPEAREYRESRSLRKANKEGASEAQ